MKQNYFCPVYTVTTNQSKSLPQAVLQQPNSSLKMPYAINDSMEFTSEDIDKIIENIIKKGNKFTYLIKALTLQEKHQLESRIYRSSFIKVIIRRTVAKMGDERRLGKGLKGFSKLLLEEIQNGAWQIILLQFSLIQKQAQQRNQIQNIKQLLSPISNESKI